MFKNWNWKKILLNTFIILFGFIYINELKGRRLTLRVLSKDSLSTKTHPQQTISKLNRPMVCYSEGHQNRSGQLHIMRLGRWEDLDMVERYTRSVKFKDSLKFYKAPLGQNNPALYVVLTIIQRYNSRRLDFIDTLSNTLGIVSIVIGILLLPLFGWLFWNGIKDRDKTSIIVSVFILAFAILVFIGAYYMFTQGLLRRAF